MRFLLFLFLLYIIPFSRGLYQEDVGKFDFLLASSGHGAVQTVLSIPNEDLLLTLAGEASCYVAARRISNGDLVWRKQMCVGNSAETTTTTTLRATLDATGLLVTQQGGLTRGWRATDGSLVWDRNTEAEIGSGGQITTETEKAECSAYGISVKVEDESVIVIAGGETLATLPGDHFWMLECTAESTQILASCSRHGTTTVVSLPSGVQWSAEEGWGHVSSGLLLDAPNRGTDLRPTPEWVGFQARLESQWNSVASTFSADHRNSMFGFGKVAVLMSSTYNRVWGLDTLSQGALRYQLDLPVTARWHRLIHGSTNGSGGHPHDVLALSYLGSEMRWLCWDGTTGHGKDEGVLTVSEEIQQILPVASASDACRQGALLTLKDGSVVAVNAALDDVVTDGRKLYAHHIDRVASRLQSMAVEKTTRLVGTALFAGEKILNVAYPPREQVVQSPCNALGDNSLLLKYLNPHLMVVVTSADPMENDESFFLPPKSHKPRKPLGVTAPQEPGTPPNLFINLVDSVAGRVLYRASHSNAETTSPVVATISENWIFYSFVNKKTRKAELGVLSLYEGKIVKDGLTAFTTPEQSTTFSSLDAPEPIVLAKTYVLPQAVTAMGVTTTKEGISGRRLIVAGLNGRLDAIDRKVLEPRRPVGKLKDEEKKEGLVQYHEVVPLLPPMALSYNRTVQGVTTILSGPTDLESQSLVLAFGGPDIFFTRTTPSRGFDLLPDSFNKALILLVLLAMAVVYLALKRVVAKKIINQGWV